MIMKVVSECSEFTLDMIRGLPTAYFYNKNNIPHICMTKKNLKELYELVSNNVSENAQFYINNPEEMYSFEEPSWTTHTWEPPPLKTMFSGILTFDKPTVVINNKCSCEWSYSSACDVISKFNLDHDLDQVIQLPDSDRCSINHYSLPMLSKLIEILSTKYQILYIKPVIESKYFLDTNILIPFNDFDYIEKNYPQVYTIRQFLRDTNLTDNFNIAQFIFESTSDRHLSIMGGNACTSAYFGGDIIVYEWEGFKLGHAKGNRGIWRSNSWLKKLSNGNIIGMGNYNNILNYIKTNWL